MIGWPRLPAAAAALAALAPGLVAALLGRALARHADDPTAPERLLEYRVRLQRTLAATIAVVLVVATAHAVWATPLALLAARAGAYPARKRLFEEEWTFGAYMLHGARVFGLLGGFWILLAASPWVVEALPLHAAAAGLAVGAVLVAWHALLPRLVPYAFEARPLDDPGLAARLDAVAARSRVPHPEIFSGGPRGSRWVNALALPSIERPGVLLSDTLLVELTPDETAAIFGHELAHLEHFDRRRLVRARGAMWLAISVACLLGVALRSATAPSLLAWMPLVWMGALLGALLFRARRRRAHEAESDRRAVELCGDADALIRALIRLHALAKVPRRWSGELERRATHPSLARRVAALRGFAAEPPPVPGTDVFASPEPGRFVILAPDRVHLLDGVPAGEPPAAPELANAAASSRAVRYEALHELRVARSSAGPVLVARETSGAAWRIRLALADVARVQRALDAVDARLAPPASSSASSPQARLVALVGLCTSLLPTGIGALALPSVLLLALPSRATLGALGASAFACSGLVLRRHAVAWPWLPAFLAVVCLACAVGSAALLLEPSRAEGPRARRIAAGTLVLAALVVGARIALAASEAHAGLLHVTARAHPGAVVFLLGAAGALASASRAAARAARRLLAALALVPLLLGSTLFLSAAEDPLVFAGREAAVVEKAATVSRREAIGFVATRLRLSPSGARWAAHREEGDGGWVVGDFGGARRELPASDLALVDDHRALVLRNVDEDDDAPAAGRAPEVALVELDPEPRVVWSRPLPRLDTARVETDGGSGRWRVTGVDFGTRELVRVSGAADGEDRKETRWPSPPVKKGVPLSSWAAGEGDAIVVVEKLFTPRASVYLDSEDLTPWHAEVWAVGKGSRRRVASTSLTLRCLSSLSPDAVCVTVTPERTYLWSVEPGSGDARPLVSVPGRSREESAAPGGGVALQTGGGALVVVDPRARRAERLKLPDGSGWATAIAASREHVGLVVSGPAGYAVVLVKR